MDFKDLVNQTIKSSRKKKWQILKEYENEINTMIENGISLRQQIQLILKAGILEKLDLKEYHTILKRHFNYKGRKKDKVLIYKIEENNDGKNTAKHNNFSKPKERRKTAADMLKKDFNIMSAAGYDFDALNN